MTLWEAVFTVKVDMGTEPPVSISESVKVVAEVAAGAIFHAEVWLLRKHRAREGATAVDARLDSLYRMENVDLVVT